MADSMMVKRTIVVEVEVVDDDALAAIIDGINKDGITYGQTYGNVNGYGYEITKVVDVLDGEA